MRNPAPAKQGLDPTALRHKQSEPCVTVARRDKALTVFGVPTTHPGLDGKGVVPPTGKASRDMDVRARMDGLDGRTPVTDRSNLVVAGHSRDGEFERYVAAHSEVRRLTCLQAALDVSVDSGNANLFVGGNAGCRPRSPNRVCRGKACGRLLQETAPPYTWHVGDCIRVSTLPPQPVRTARDLLEGVRSGSHVQLAISKQSARRPLTGNTARMTGALPRPMDMVNCAKGLSLAQRASRGAKRRVTRRAFCCCVTFATNIGMIPYRM